MPESPYYIQPPHFPFLHGPQRLYRQTRLLWSNMSHVKLFHFLAVATLLVSSLLLSITATSEQQQQRQQQKHQEGGEEGKAAAGCSTTITASQANPIAQQYPEVPTGTFNTTLAIVPIPMAQARQLIPSQYAILEGAFRSLLPSFPADMYPVVMQAGLDHDIQLPAYGITVPDFQRIGWSFPFLDLLGDGYSSFTWAPAQMISDHNQIAIEGSRDYGTVVSAASFAPHCEAYGRSANNNNGSVSFSANATDGSNTFAMLDFSPLESDSGDTATTTSDNNPFPVAFYQNITNQPIFANGSQCDRQIRLFNSTLNQGAYAPVPVKGTIWANLAPLVDAAAAAASGGGGGGLMTDVFGLLIDTPFIEYNGLDCQSLKGYSGTGSGD